jgi:hypothetical protein
VASLNQIACAVDEFLRSEKKVVGLDEPGDWSIGRNSHERVLYLPLEIRGEQNGSKLMIVGFPRARDLKFRLGIILEVMICRLDYTDEVHENSLSAIPLEIPFTVKGPHYHSWPINREFCKGGSLPSKLLKAAPFTTSARSFDAILRWFCADNGIEGFPPHHKVELPRSDLLL